MNWYKVTNKSRWGGKSTYAVFAETPEKALKRWASFCGYLQVPSTARVHSTPLNESEVETIYNRMR